MKLVDESSVRKKEMINKVMTAESILTTERGA